MVHVAGPEVLDDAAAPVRDGGDFDDRHVHFRLRVAENFAERILLFAHARQNLAFDDDFGVGGNHEFVAPGGRRCHP